MKYFWGSHYDRGLWDLSFSCFSLPPFPCIHLRWGLVVDGTINLKQLLRPRNTPSGPPEVSRRYRNGGIPRHGGPSHFKILKVRLVLLCADLNLLFSWHCLLLEWSNFVSYLILAVRLVPCTHISVSTYIIIHCIVTPVHSFRRALYHRFHPSIRPGPPTSCLGGLPSCGLGTSVLGVDGSWYTRFCRNLKAKAGKNTNQWTGNICSMAKWLGKNTEMVKLLWNNIEIQS